MDSLRVTLLIIGTLVIVAIYFKYRSQDQHLLSVLKNLFGKTAVAPIIPGKPSTVEDDLIPVLSPIDDEPDVQDFEQLSLMIANRDRIEPAATQQANFSAAEQVAETGNETLLIVMYVMAPRGMAFTGEGIQQVMQDLELEYDPQQIFHYKQDGQSVFGMASAVEPGVFDLHKMHEIVTPGIVMFLQLPGPMECRQAFEKMLLTGQSLAKHLGGELHDEQRSVMTGQTIAHLKERVDAYRLKQQLSRRQH